VISKPRTAVGGGLLVAVLLVSGCQARVGSAATVGDDRISTKTFTSTVNAAAATAKGANKASLQRQVLAELVQVQAARVVARRLGLSTTPGDIDLSLTQVKQGLADQSQSLPDNLVQLAAELQALETKVGSYFVEHGGSADQDHVLGFQVKDKATGQQVLAKLASDGSNLAKLAATYSANQSTSTTLGTVDISRVQELVGLKRGQSTVATITDNSSGTVTRMFYVLYVDSQFDQKDMSKALSEVKVRINPRFGTWSQDPSTGAFQVLPATSDIVAPVPSGAAQPSAPAPSAPAASSPAPSGPAPAQSGPASAPAGPAPSAAAPSATTAPAPTATPSATPSS
jgi:hypothetical protein